MVNQSNIPVYWQCQLFSFKHLYILVAMNTRHNYEQINVHGFVKIE